MRIDDLISDNDKEFLQEKRIKRTIFILRACIIGCIIDLPFTFISKRNPLSIIILTVMMIALYVFYQKRIYSNYIKEDDVELNELLDIEIPEIEPEEKLEMSEEELNQAFWESVREAEEAEKM